MPTHLFRSVKSTVHYGIEHSLGTAKIRLNAIPDKEIFYCVIRSHVKNVLHGD